MSGPFPEDSAARKTYPVYSGLFAYFPAALARVANHSFVSNEKHNPGEPMHWARGKSDDHLDAAGRHLIEGDLAGLAWRALAALQLEEEAKGAPVAPGSRIFMESASALDSVSMAPPFPMPPGVELDGIASLRLAEALDRADEDGPTSGLKAGEALNPVAQDTGD